MFVILGLSTLIIFFTLGWLPTGLATPCNFVSYAVGGAIYIIGAIIFVAKYPEKWKPGAFDFCGASHQIFHFCVLFACLLMYYESYNMYLNRQYMECPIWID